MFRLLALLTAFVWLHGAATVRAEKPELHAADAYTEVFSEWSARRLPEAAEEHIGPNSPYDHQTTLALRPRRSLHGSRTMTGAPHHTVFRHRWQPTAADQPAIRQNPACRYRCDVRCSASTGSDRK